MLLFRELGLTEYYSKLCHDYANGATKLMGVLQVEGGVSVGAVNESLRGMLRVHPMLRACFQKQEKGSDRLIVNKAPDHLPMEVLSRESDTQWQDIYEEDINTPFSSHAPFLWRLKLLYGGDAPSAEHELMVQFHHVISDGISVASFFKQLLEGLDGRFKKPFPFFPAVEETIPDSPGWWTFFRKKMVSTGQFFTLMRLNRYETHVPFSQRNTRMLYRRLDENKLSTLISACRKEGTTLTGLITAVLSRSVFRLYGQKKSLKQITFTPVSLRKNCCPQVSENQIGCFVNFYQTTHILKEESGIWEIARAFREQLKNSMADTSNLSPRTFYKKWFNPLITSMSHGIIKHVFPYGIGVTNIGAADLIERAGGLKIRQFYFSTNRNMGDWLTLLHTSSVNGNLFLCFCVCDPLISMNSANRLANYVVDSLTAIADKKRQTRAFRA